uniref:Uncharacterized protein n=1 Tax=Lactuca sativa TaxID=4236 RepID=A0A9R1VGV9_LACSA|nr:hypothetical protein LSAT_V11C500238940 [Lactuca sativa]
MSGALAWQVKSVNEIIVFVLVEGDGTGLPGSPSFLVRLRSLLFFFAISLSCQRSKNVKRGSNFVPKLSRLRALITQSIQHQTLEINIETVLSGMQLCALEGLGMRVMTSYGNRIGTHLCL